MAAQVHSNIFRPDEMMTDAEVEALETTEQPTSPEQPGTAGPDQGQQPPPPQQPPPEEEQQHEEAVPYERFKAFLDANKALEEEVAQHREFRTRLDERQRILQEERQRQERAAEIQRRAAERPDPSLDPVGAELYDQRQRSAQYEAQIRQLQDQLNNFGQTYQSTREQEQFADWVKQEANTYAQGDPHYFPAAQYAAQKRVNFWKAIAPNAPQGLAERIVEGESVMIARLSQQYGGRFAPAVTQLAREWGYAPQPTPQQQNGNVVPMRQPTSPQAVQRQANLRQVQNGQRVQGLGAVPSAGNSNEGGSAYRNYSPADIANMSEREFMQCMSNPVTARDLRYAMAKAEGLEGQELSW